MATPALDVQEIIDEMTDYQLRAAIECAVDLIELPWDEAVNGALYRGAELVVGHLVDDFLDIQGGGCHGSILLSRRDRNQGRSRRAPPRSRPCAAAPQDRAAVPPAAPRRKN